MTKRFLLWLRQVGLLGDEALNVLALGGASDQTVSQDAAVADLQLHERWAVWLCAALSVLVQRGHCAKQIAGAPMSFCNYVRALICIVAAFGVIWFCADWLAHAATGVVHMVLSRA